MEYQTVNSREIVIPELAVTLHIHAVELPGSMSEAADGRHSEELDALLVAVCQEVFRVRLGAFPLRPTRHSRFTGGRLAFVCQERSKVVLELSGGGNQQNAPSTNPTKSRFVAQISTATLPERHN